jgi:hypothetical protein
VLGNGSFNAVINTGDFKLSVSPLPSGMFVKSMRLGNTDVLSEGLHINGQPDGGLEIVIGSGGAELSGVVNSGASKVAPNSIVALVPDALALRKRLDLYRSATTDHEGRFKLQNVLPGTYKLFAWEYAPPDAWLDPSFVQLYESSGKSVSLRDGEKQETAAAVIPLRRAQ